MEDSKIIDLYWQRSENAISATAEKYGSYCYTIANNILHNDQDVEECVNDTYLGAWNAMPPNKPNCLSTFLGKITRNLSLNRYKLYNTAKRGAGQTELVLSELEDCIPAQSDVEQAVEDRIIVKSLNDFLYSLPGQKRNIFVRRYWLLSPIRDIADACCMSEAKVTSMLFRMRKELKSHLEKEDIIL